MLELIEVVGFGCILFLCEYLNHKKQKEGTSIEDIESKRGFGGSDNMG